MLTNPEIRAQAREYLTGKWNACAIILLVYYVLSIGAGYIPGVGFIASMLIAGPISLSLALIFLRITRGEEVKVEMIFEGFYDFTRSFVTVLLTTLYILLWCLLLIIPGFIAGLSYSMVYFILAENPKISAIDAIKQSKEMMYGHKMELFLLTLSFLGWILLGIISMGIGFLWIGSYIQTSLAIFYQELKAEPVLVRSAE